MNQIGLQTGGRGVVYRHLRGGRIALVAILGRFGANFIAERDDLDILTFLEQLETLNRVGVLLGSHVAVFVGVNTAKDDHRRGYQLPADFPRPDYHVTSRSSRASNTPAASASP